MKIVSYSCTFGAYCTVYIVYSYVINIYSYVYDCKGTCINPVWKTWHFFIFHSKLIAQVDILVYRFIEKVT